MSSMLGLFGATTTSATKKPPAGKNIVVFCDGTGQDGLISTLSREELAVQPPFKKPGHSSTYATNVLRLSRCVRPFTNSEPIVFQLVFYQSGVGVGNDFQGDSDVGDDSEKARGNATGSKIRDTYNFISQNYVDGDKIYLFGFSRGAYTARKVAGLIDRLGLLSRREMGEFFKYWSALDRGDPDFHYEAKNVPPIEFVGTWDTVGTVLENNTLKLDALTLLDTALPKNVKVARHALSFHENRKEFLPTPYSGFDTDRDVQQVWFPGVHSDVGGGYKEHLIADLTLCWMAGEANKAGLALDEEYLKDCFTADRELRLHYERRPGIPLMTVNRMNVLVNTDVSDEVKLTNTDTEFLYHPSLWAEVIEHPNGPSRKAFSGKEGEPAKKKLTAFEEIYWDEFGWKELLPQLMARVPMPRGGPTVIQTPSHSPSPPSPGVVGRQPVEFENFSDYLQEMSVG